MTSTILLALFLIVSVSAIPIPEVPGQTAILVGWQSEPRGRGTFSIITTCGVTLGLCVWTAIHPNVLPGATRFARFMKKVEWTLKALLIPEEVVSAAWTEWKQTRQLHRAPVYQAYISCYERDGKAAAARALNPRLSMESHLNSLSPTPEIVMCAVSSTEGAIDPRKLAQIDTTVKHDKAEPN